jgi:uridylate kinase
VKIKKRLIWSLKQVWKDVDGVLTCDPNLCPQAEPVPFLTFDEAAELAYFGAQVSLYSLVFFCQYTVYHFFYRGAMRRFTNVKALLHA